MDTIKIKSPSSNSVLNEKLTALSLLLKQNRFTPEQIELIESLSQEFETFEVQLGDELMVHPGVETNYNQSELDSQCFFLVCEGQLRLLRFDPDKQREVSANLLTEGATVGGEFFWSEKSLSYRVVAATDAIVAKISLNKLESFLPKLPELVRKWQTETEQHQKLLFFKTLTELSSLPSRRLKQLLPYLVENKIRAGDCLTTKGCRDVFWLRSGQIEDRIEIGDSWANSANSNWVAKTDLWVYQLPEANWQVFSELAPELTSVWSDNSDRLSKTKSLNKNQKTQNVKAITNVKTPGLNITPAVNPNRPDNTSPTEAEKIIYPKPIKRRRLWKAYPYIKQQSSSDCGAACLGMISRYWGKRLSINYLRELIGIGRSGSSLKSLAKAAESLGYHARPVRASLNRIVEEKDPWIAHWQGDHYVVVYRIKGGRILIADPATGIKQIARSEFLTHWTGYALILNPTENLYEAPTEKRSLGRFFNLLLPYRSLGLTIILASVLIQILGLISPLFTQIILDQVVVNKSQSTLNVLVIGILMFGALGIGLSSVRNYLLSYLANRLDLTMIGGFINHALNLPLKFFESRRVGDIITRVQENQKIQQFLIQNVMLSWLDFLTGFVYLGLMLYYNWQLTVLILCLIPPIVILTLAATPLLRKVSRERFNATADQNSSLVEMRREYLRSKP